MKTGTESLCRFEFDKVTAIESKPGGPLPAAQVSYRRHNVAQSKLYARLKQSNRPLGAFCDAGVVEAGRVLVVQRQAGWRANRPPAWDGDWKAETSYEHNQGGQLTGAVTKIALTGRVVDADGDAVVEGGWSARRPAVKERGADGRATRVESVDAPIVVEASSVTFRPEIWDGRPAGGELRLEARDPWEAGGLTICLDGSGWSC
jgi:hypothetical protein